MSDPPGPSSSGDFWEEAIALEPPNLQPSANDNAPHRALSAAHASQRVVSNSRNSVSFANTISRPEKRPLEDEEDPYTSARRRRYVLSPDSSEDTSPLRPARSARRSPTSASRAPDTTVSVSFLETSLRNGPIDGAQSYLAGDEYRPTAFGDIGDYMRKKDIKVQTQNAQLALTAAAEGIPQIFTGLQFYINGNTTPPMEVLRKMIVQRGGIVQPYLRTKSNIDYVIAPVLTLAKFKDLAKGGRLRVVKEGFVVQSAEEGRIVDWKRWRLTPEGTEGGLEGFMTQRGKRSSAAAGAVEKGGEEAKNDEDTDITPTRARPVASTSRLPMTPAPTAAAGSLLVRKGVASRPHAPPVAARRNLLAPTSQALRMPSQRRPGLAQPSRRSPPSIGPTSPPVPPPPAEDDTRRTIPVTEVPRLVTNLKQLHEQSSTSSVGGTSAALDPRTAANSSQTDFGDLINLADIEMPEINGGVERPDASMVLEHPAPEGSDVKRLDRPAQFLNAETPDAVEESYAPRPPPPLEVVEIETTDPDPNAAPARPEGAWENYAVHRSNPYASRLMQTEGFREQKTAVQGMAFIDSFYQNSRLHLLSTWKAALKVLVSEARSMAGHVPRVLPPASAERVIFHVDFDAFFVSAGMATRPHLVGKPVVVCHTSRGGRDSTSEIASASYEARALGVRNGMSLGRARQLCGDDLETIPYDFETYKSHSTAFYAVLLAYADELEAVSIDEALLDITGAVTACALNPDEAGADTDPAVTVAARVRADIKEKTGCNVSIGIAHNILLARLATRAAKPPASGIYHLLEPGIPAFLAELDVGNFPSFGHSAKRKLEAAFGSTTVGALLAQSRDSLRRVLGPKTGDTLHAFLRGKDNRRLEPDKARKSVSAEINYAIRFADQAEADAYVLNLAGEVGKRLRSIGAKGRHLTLKIMVRDKDAPVEPPKFLGHGRCETFNKSAPFARYTDDGGVVGAECVKLLHGMRLDPVELRGIGIQVTKLEFGGDVGGGQPTISFKGKGVGKREGEGQRSVSAMLAEDEEREEREEREETPNSMPSPPPSPGLVPTAPPSPSRDDPRPGAQASSEIDPDLLAHLPPEVHADAKAQIRAERASKREHPQPVPPPAAAPARNPAAHITKQLRPKLKTQLRATEIAELPLYTAWGRAGERAERSKSRSASLAPDGVEVIDVDAEDDIGGYAARELRALGIDLDVFAALPPDVQADAVAQKRTEKGRQAALFRPKPKGRGETPPAGLRRAALPPPVAHIPHKPALGNHTDLPAVARQLAQWVASTPAPETGDVARVRKYLLKCLARMGMGGIEHVTALLRGMRVVVGTEAWCEAWESLRDAVDEEVRRSMGAGLRL